MNIIYIRHGFSCANAIQHLSSKWHQYKRFFFKDPPLTDWAKDEIKAVQGDVQWGRHIDMVLASTMLRAIQTACALFPKREVTVVPFMKESGHGPSNRPVTIEEQLAQLTSEERQQVNFDLAMHPGRHGSHITSFKDWLGEKLPQLMDLSKKKEITIAIVTHSQLMKKQLGGTLPKNIESIMFPYDWHEGTLHVTGRRVILYPGLPIPSKEAFREAQGDKSCKYRA